MSEDAWFELISASIDGELSADEQAHVERRIERSPRAREIQQEIVAVRRRTLIHSTEPIPDLADEIVAQSRLDPESPLAADGQRGRRRRWLVGTGVAAAAASLVIVVAFVAARPWSSSDQSTNEQATIVASDSSFDHTDVRVEAGSAITWVNAGSTTHRLVQQLPDASVSGLLGPDEDRSVTFEETGVYEFYCGIHDNMTGTVTVDD